MKGNRKEPTFFGEGGGQKKENFPGEEGNLGALKSVALVYKRCHVFSEGNYAFLFFFFTSNCFPFLKTPLRDYPYITEGDFSFQDYALKCAMSTQLRLLGYLLIKVLFYGGEG